MSDQGVIAEALPPQKSRGIHTWASNRVSRSVPLDASCVRVLFAEVRNIALLSKKERPERNNIPLFRLQSPKEGKNRIETIKSHKAQHGVAIREYRAPVSRSKAPR